MTTLRARMGPPDRRDVHRVATPLELLFDLCFVVAAAQASAHLWGYGHLAVFASTAAVGAGLAGMPLARSARGEHAS
jgi:low temperature requirement protein LtrA